MKVYVVCYRKDREAMNPYYDFDSTGNVVGVTTTKEAALDLVLKFIERELKRFEDWKGCLPDKFKAPAPGRFNYQDCIDGFKYIEHACGDFDEIHLYWWIQIREFITAD